MSVCSSLSRGVEVVVPCARPSTVEALLYSLAASETRPDLVTLVSNEFVDTQCSTFGLDVRRLSYSATEYCFGHRDISLRRNVGIYEALHETLVFFDDDQVAPMNMIADAARALGDHPAAWGNYRFVDVESFDIDELLKADPSVGRSRETSVNATHSWHSGYAGMLVAKTDALVAACGFDMAYSCGGEDQSLAYRMAPSGRIKVHEPPFAWHPTYRMALAPAPLTNACSGEHDLRSKVISGTRVLACTRCPYVDVINKWNAPAGIMPIIEYRHDVVRVEETVVRDTKENQRPDLRSTHARL